MSASVPVIKNFLFQTADEDITGLEQVYLDKYAKAARNLRAELRIVTPPWAQGVLGNFNNHNRSISAWHRRLADVMRRGNWEVGEPICFDENNELTNGQHRLSAVVLYNRPVPFVVLYGLDPAVFDVTDRVRPRKNSDVLNIMGKDHARTLASALGWLVAYDGGKIENPAERSVPYDMLSDVMDQYPTIDSSVGFAHLNLSQHLPPGLTAFLYHRMLEVDPKLCVPFFKKVLHSTDLTQSSHEWLLVRRLADLRGRRSTPDQIHLAALVIKTWNRLRSNTPPKSALIWRRGSGPAEPFPTII